MTTVFAGGPPPEIGEWLDHRRRLGLDLRDELWDGVLHVAPYAENAHGRLEDEIAYLLRPRALAAGLVPGGRFTLGEPGDFRVPDGGYYRDPARRVYVAEAVVVVEILSPGDETYEKFGFYAAHGVEEVLVVDPEPRTVRWWARSGDAYVETTASTVLAVTGAEMAAEIEWP